MSFGTEPPLENAEGLKKHQEQLIAAGIKNSSLLSGYNPNRFN
jgi:hypothetical protein